MLRINLLIEKTAANKDLNFWLKSIHNICKIKLTLRYFSYIYIPYQMYQTWSCVTFHHSLNRFPEANVSRISISWKWVNAEVYTRSIWFHFELNLSSFSGFLWKKSLVKRKMLAKIILANKCSGKNTKVSTPFEPF